MYPRSNYRPEYEAPRLRRRLLPRPAVDSLPGVSTPIRRIPVEETFSWQKPVTNFLSAPPGGASRGDRYKVLATGTGAWAGQDENIAWFDGVNWAFDVPSDGWFVFNRNDSTLYVFDGATWGTTY